MTKTEAIFVVGNSRSGTTMMGRLLGNNPEVFMFRELHFFEQLWLPEDAPELLGRADAVQLAATLLSIQRIGYAERRDIKPWLEEAEELVKALSPDQYYPTSIYKHFLTSEAEKEGGRIPLEQTPRNVFYLEQVYKVFPRALVVEMVRDPRDVLLSKRHKWKRAFYSATKRPFWTAILAWANYQPYLTPRLWVSAVNAAKKFANGDGYIRVRYEDLLADPEQTVRHICAAAGITFDQSMLLVPQVGSSSKIDSAEMGIAARNREKWREGGLSATEIYLCQKVAGQEMADNGYEMEAVSPRYLLLAAIFIGLPFKILIAMVLNISRMSSFFHAIKRRFN